MDARRSAYRQIEEDFYSRTCRCPTASCSASRPLEAQLSGAIVQDRVKGEFKQVRNLGVARYRCTAPTNHAAYLSTASTGLWSVRASHDVVKGHISTSEDVPIYFLVYRLPRACYEPG